MIQLSHIYLLGRRARLCVQQIVHFLCISRSECAREIIWVITVFLKNSWNYTVLQGKVTCNLLTVAVGRTEVQSAVQAPYFSDFEMETCRWDVKNSIAFNFSVKSIASHLDHTCCLPVTALIVSSLFMWLKQEAKQWRTHCHISLLKSDFIRSILCCQRCSH